MVVLLTSNRLFRQRDNNGGLQTGGSGGLLTSQSVQALNADYLIYAMQIQTLSLHFGLHSLLMMSAKSSSVCEEPTPVEVSLKKNDNVIMGALQENRKYHN